MTRDELAYKGTAATLYARDALAVCRDLPNASIDAVITDPPYSSGGRRENARSIRKTMTRTVSDEEWIPGDSLSTNGFTWMMRELAIEWRRALRPGGHVLSFIDWRMAPVLAAALESADLRVHPWLVWNKDVIGMGAIFRNQHEFVLHFSAGNPTPPQRRDVPNVLTYRPVRDGDHPTEKPLALMRTLVSVVVPRGGVVLDPFAGSGTTGVAALLEGRRFVGAEMKDEYLDVSRARLSVAETGYDERAPQRSLLEAVKA